MENTTPTPKQELAELQAKLQVTLQAGRGMLKRIDALKAAIEAKRAEIESKESNSD